MMARASAVPSSAGICAGSSTGAAVRSMLAARTGTCFGGVDGGSAFGAAAWGSIVGDGDSDGAALSTAGAGKRSLGAAAAPGHAGERFDDAAIGGTALRLLSPVSESVSGEVSAAGRSAGAAMLGGAGGAVAECGGAVSVCAALSGRWCQQ